MVILILAIMAYVQCVLWFEWVLHLQDRTEELRADWHETIANALARARNQLGMERCDYCGRFVPDYFIEVIPLGGVFDEGSPQDLKVYVDPRSVPQGRRIKSQIESGIRACNHCLYGEDYP